MYVQFIPQFATYDTITIERTNISFVDTCNKAFFFTMQKSF